MGSKWERSSGRSSKLLRISASALFSILTSPLSSRLPWKWNACSTHSRQRRSVCVLIPGTVYTEAERDPVDEARKYRSLLHYVHIKDVDASVLGEARRQKLNFEQAIGAGVFSRGSEADVSISTVSFDSWPKVQRIQAAVVECDAMLYGRRIVHASWRACAPVCAI